MVKAAKQPNPSTPSPSNPMVYVEVNSIQIMQSSSNKKKEKGKNKKPRNQQENPKPTTPKNDNKGKRKDKYPYLLCGGDNFMKECPYCGEINNFLKTNPAPTVLIDPFPSQQQLIDHMSNQGNSSSTEEVRMMSSKTVSLTTRIQSYDKSEEKKNENPSLDKAPSTGSLASWSNGPLTIEKPNSRHYFVSTQEYS